MCRLYVFGCMLYARGLFLFCSSQPLNNKVVSCAQPTIFTLHAWCEINAASTLW